MKSCFLWQINNFDMKFYVPFTVYVKSCFVGKINTKDLAFMPSLDSFFFLKFLSAWQMNTCVVYGISIFCSSILCSCWVRQINTFDAYRAFKSTLYSSILCSCLIWQINICVLYRVFKFTPHIGKSTY